MILAAPSTKREPLTEDLHGAAIADPYRWLEEATAADTIAWIARQDEYARSVLESLPARETIRRRLTELMLNVESGRVPIARAGRYFYTRRDAGTFRHSICMRRGLEGSDEVILDPSLVTPSGNMTIRLEDVSASGRLVVYSVRHGGEDESELRIFDVERGTDLPDVLPSARYLDCAVTANDAGLYYTRVESDGCRLYRRAFDSHADELVFGSNLGRDHIVLFSLSDDGRFLLVQVQKGGGLQASIQVYLQDLAHDTEPHRVIHDEAHGEAKLGGHELFLLTSSSAPNHRIMALDLADGGQSGRWREVVPEGPGVIEKFSAAAGRLFVQYLENVTSRLRVFRPDGAFERELSFGTLGQLSKVVGQWSGRDVFISFASFHLPLTIYRYDAAAATLAIWLKRNIPFDPEALELHQIWYRARDGMAIPMFIIHKRGLERTGDHPVLLTGYGGFGQSTKPWFRPEAVLWAEMGGVYAVANVRGGGEFGVAWHEAATLANKQVSFDDFIAGAEHLIAAGYTAPERIGITGSSNGGLLVAAALTQRPELFRAVVCRFPLADMLRYHRFAVGRWWIAEYGCADDAEQCAYLCAYSPYHRVEPGVAYPAVLVRTGGSDTRVDPSHARKLAAALQFATASTRPVLFRCEASAGHAMPPLTSQLDEHVDELSFLCSQLDMAPIVDTGHLAGAVACEVR